MTDKIKITAACSAVLAYLQEEEALARAALEGPPVVIEPRPNIWGQSGRQAQMQLRTLMQMKMSGR